MIAQLLKSLLNGLQPKWRLLLFERWAMNTEANLDGCGLGESRIVARELVISGRADLQGHLPLAGL